MNKKKILNILLMAIFFIIVLCMSGKILELVVNLILDKKENVNRSTDNVVIQIIENTVTPTGVTIVITDRNEQHYIWGEQFRIQQKVNGEWKDLKYLNNIVSFPEIAYVADKNNQLTQKIDWTMYYGKLPSGIYRIVKQVYDNQYINLYSNEFKIKRIE